MSRWSRAPNDDSGQLLARNGSFSSSSQSYYPIADDGVEMDQAASQAPATNASSSTASSAFPQPTFPSSAQPFHLPVAPPAPVQPSPSALPSSDPSSSAAPSDLSSSSTKAITISFRTLSGQVMSVSFASLDGVTVAELKRRLEETHSIPVSFQRLIFSGRELTADEEAVASYGMEDGGMVHLLLRQNQVPAGAPAASPVAGGVGVDSEGMGFFNGLNIPVQPAGDGAGINEEDAERLVQTVRLSRAIKFLALISVLGLMIVAVKAPPFMAGAVFGLAGYYGAHHYQPRLLLCFFVYIATSVAARLYIILSTAVVEYYVVFSFGILLDLYLARLAATLYKLCTHLTPADRHELIMLSRYASPAPRIASSPPARAHRSHALTVTRSFRYAPLSLACNADRASMGTKRATQRAGAAV